MFAAVSILFAVRSAGRLGVASHRLCAINPVVVKSARFLTGQQTTAASAVPMQD
jgi:hypothetical protein